MTALIRAIGPLMQQVGGDGDGALALPAAILALDPIAYWKLDETTGTTATDSSGNGHHGTYTGTYSLASVEGPDGVSYVDLAGGYITVPDDDVFSMDTASGLTLFACILPDDTDTGREFIISKGGVSSRYEWEMTINNLSGGQIWMIVYRNSDANALSSKYVDSAITAGEWNIATTRIGSPVYNADSDIFVNTALELTAGAGSTQSGTYGNITAPVVIGNRNDNPASGAQSFRGTIAHVAVFAGEIDPLTLYQAAVVDGWGVSPHYFADELTITTYDGSGEATHPSVVDMGSAWNGYRYWLAFTPYPSGDEDYENPSILASNDLDTWVLPSGASNPIDAKPTTGYNADTELVYDASNDRLICYYSEFDLSTTKYIRARTSTDGVTWSSEQSVYSVTYPANNELSGSVVKVGSTWWQWFVTDGDNPNKLRYRTSSSPLSGWSASSECTITGGIPASGRDLWHLGVFEDDGGVLRMLMTDCASGANGTGTNEVFCASSSDGIDWNIDPEPVLIPGSSWYSNRMYRATAFQSGNDVEVIVSAAAASEEWGIGRATITLGRWPDPPA